jgi:hypothetical protein
VATLSTVARPQRVDKREISEIVQRVTKRGEGPWLHRIFPPGKNFEALSLILSGADVRPRTTSFWSLPLIRLPAIL